MQPAKKKRPKRIRRSPSVVFYVALSVALSIIAALALTTRPADNATAEPAVRIVNEDDMMLIPTPSRAVARGERLSAVPMAMLKWPKSKVSAEYLAEVGNYRDAIATTPLPKLLPIPVSALSMNDDGNGVTDSIPPGMRAITIRVDAQSAVEGWAQSGSHVDVVLIKPDSGEKGKLKTRVIAQNIKVLSVNSSAEPARADQVASKAPATVTLLTSQQDALTIMTAANVGRLMFTLRGSEDRGAPEVTDIDSGGYDVEQNPRGSAEEGFVDRAIVDGKVYEFHRGRWLEVTDKQNSGEYSRAALSAVAPPAAPQAAAANLTPPANTKP